MDKMQNNTSKNGKEDGKEEEYQKAKDGEGETLQQQLRYHTPSPDDALVWLLHCSPLMRDLAEMPLDDDEHEGNSSLTERAARVFPKWSVCAEHDPDWRLVAKVIHEWSVDPAPFWFYDLVVRAHDRHGFSSTTYELWQLVQETKDTPILHQYWRSLLALSCQYTWEGGPARGVPHGPTVRGPPVGYAASAKACNDDGTYYVDKEWIEDRFWSCLRAYAYSKNTQFLDYWTTHLALVPLPVSKNNLCGMASFSEKSFWELVVDARDMWALNAVLQQVLQWGKRGWWLVSDTSALFECLFAADWAEAWETTAQFFFAHTKELTMHERLDFQRVPVASHPAAIPWAYTFLQKVRLALQDVPENRSHFTRFNWCNLWCTDCILQMAAAGRLGALSEVGEELLPPPLRSVGTLLECLRQCKRTAAIAPIVLRLREVMDRTAAAASASTHRAELASVAQTCWRLVVDDATKDGDCVCRWVTLEELSRNGLFRLPAVDSNEGAAAFAELFSDVAYAIEKNSGRARSLRNGRNRDDPTPKNDHWKPMCGVHLRAGMSKLNAFGWGTDPRELRAMLGRLTGEVEGEIGIRLSFTYKLYCSVDEFMELLDADSESTQRVKRLKCA